MRDVGKATAQGSYLRSRATERKGTAVQETDRGVCQPVRKHPAV